VPRHDHRTLTTMRAPDALFLSVLTEEINLVRRDLGLPERSVEDVCTQWQYAQRAQRRTAAPVPEEGGTSWPS
jgi:hypothetical protein